MFNMDFYDLGYCEEKDYTRVVCVSRYKGKFVFSYNKERKGWEIPGGHIEEGENWQEAAKREMYEETGATSISLKPICVYKITTFGLLCFCEIKELEKLPKEYEMSEILLADELPNDLTFPESAKMYFDKVLEVINN